MPGLGRDTIELDIHEDGADEAHENQHAERQGTWGAPAPPLQASPGDASAAGVGGEAESTACQQQTGLRNASTTAEGALPAGACEAFESVKTSGLVKSLPSTLVAPQGKGSAQRRKGRDRVCMRRPLS